MTDSLRSDLLDAVIAANRPDEGYVNGMYRDRRGFVTCGVGLLIDSPAAACRLSWQHRDGSPADAGEVVVEWNRVHALPANLIWQRYVSPSGLKLSDETIERACRQRVTADAQLLAVHWPDFYNFPDAAIVALLLLAYAVGAGSTGQGLTGATWPHLGAAVAQQDWMAASVAGQLTIVNNPGVGPRDVQIKVLFERAANPTTRTGTIPPPGG